MFWRYEMSDYSYNQSHLTDEELVDEIASTKSAMHMAVMALSNFINDPKCASSMLALMQCAHAVSADNDTRIELTHRNVQNGLTIIDFDSRLRVFEITHEVPRTDIGSVDHPYCSEYRVSYDVNGRVLHFRDGSVFDVPMIKFDLKNYSDIDCMIECINSLLKHKFSCQIPTDGSLFGNLAYWYDDDTFVKKVVFSIKLFDVNELD